MNKVWELLHIRTLLRNQVRSFIEFPYLPENEGIKYHGFTYYPRRPDFKDPPYNPSPLFLVTRIKPFHHLNPVEKKALIELKLNGTSPREQKFAIIKNTPDNCATLWKIKHLVRIVSIQFPNGRLKEEDIGSMYLRDNGQIVVTENLHINKERLAATEKYLNDQKRLNNMYMREYLRLRWLNPLIKDL